MWVIDKQKIMIHCLLYDWTALSFVLEIKFCRDNPCINSTNCLDINTFPYFLCLSCPSGKTGVRCDVGKYHFSEVSGHNLTLVCCCCHQSRRRRLCYVFLCNKQNTWINTSSSRSYDSLFFTNKACQFLKDKTVTSNSIRKNDA